MKDIDLNYLDYNLYLAEDSSSKCREVEQGGGGFCRKETCHEDERSYPSKKCKYEKNSYTIDLMIIHKPTFYYT